MAEQNSLQRWEEALQNAPVLGTFRLYALLTSKRGSWN